MRTAKQLWGIFACLQLDGDISLRRSVFHRRPAQTLTIFPNVGICEPIVLAQHMLGFVQEYHRPLGIIDGPAEEIRVNGHDLERKIGCCKCTFLGRQTIKPVVRTAKGRRVFEQECLFIKALFTQQVDRTVDALSLFTIYGNGRRYQREVKCRKCQRSNQDQPRSHYDVTQPGLGRRRVPNGINCLRKFGRHSIRLIDSGQQFYIEMPERGKNIRRI